MKGVACGKSNFIFHRNDSVVGSCLWYLRPTRSHGVQHRARGNLRGLMRWVIALPQGHTGSTRTQLAACRCGCESTPSLYTNVPLSHCLSLPPSLSAGARAGAGASHHFNGVEQLKRAHASPFCYKAQGIQIPITFSKLKSTLRRQR